MIVPELKIDKTLQDVSFSLCSIKSLDQFSCNCSELTQSLCNWKKTLTFKEDGKAVLQLFMIKICNKSSSSVKLENFDFKAISNNGYIYDGAIICPFQNKYLSQKKETVLLPNCVYNIGIVFNQPEDFNLESGELFPNSIISLISIFYKRISYKEIEPESPRIDFLIDLSGKPFIAQQEDKAEKEAELKRQQERDANLYYLEHVKYKHIGKMKQLIFQRFNNNISTKQKLQYEDWINNHIFHVRQFIEDNRKKFYDSILPEFQTFINEFYEIISSYDKSLMLADKEDSIIKEIFIGHNYSYRSLYSIKQLTPREFELFSGDLLQYLGYNDISVTRYVNDGGIDVICYNNGKKVVAQCKKWEAAIGSPELQSFLGSMIHEKAEQGIFITTSHFSLEAESFAIEHKIKLIDGISLTEILQNIK